MDVKPYCYQFPIYIFRLDVNTWGTLNAVTSLVSICYTCAGPCDQKKSESAIQKHSLKPQTMQMYKHGGQEKLPRKAGTQEEPGSDVWLCQVEIRRVHGHLRLNCSSRFFYVYIFVFNLYLTRQLRTMMAYTAKPGQCLIYFMSKCQLAFHSRAFKGRESRCR